MTGDVPSSDASKVKLMTRALSLKDNPAGCYPIDVFVAKRNERAIILPSVDLSGYVPLVINIPCNLMQDGATSFHHGQFLETSAAKAKCDELDLFQYLVHMCKEEANGVYLTSPRRPVLVYTHTVIETLNGDDGYHILTAFINPNAGFNPMQTIHKRMAENRKIHQHNNPSLINSNNDGFGDAHLSFGDVYDHQDRNGGGSAAGGGGGGAGGGGGGGKKPQFKKFIPPPKKRSFVPFHLRMMTMHDFANVAQLKNRIDYASAFEMSDNWASDNPDQNLLHPYEVFSLPFALTEMSDVAPKYKSLSEYIMMRSDGPPSYIHPCPERAYWITINQIDVNTYYRYRLPNPKRDNIIHLSEDMRILSKPTVVATTPEERQASEKRERTKEVLRLRQRSGEAIPLVPKGLDMQKIMYETHTFVRVENDIDHWVLKDKSHRISPHELWMADSADVYTDDCNQHGYPNATEYGEGEAEEEEEGEGEDAAYAGMNDEGEEGRAEGCARNVEGRRAGGGGGGAGGSDECDDSVSPTKALDHNVDQEDGLMHSCTTRGMPTDQSYDLRIFHSIFSCVNDAEVMRILFPDLYSLPMSDEDRELYFIIRGSVGLAVDVHASEDDVDHAKRINKFHRNLNQKAIIAMQRENRSPQEIRQAKFRLREEFEARALDRMTHTLWSTNANASPYWRANVKFVNERRIENNGLLFANNRFTKITSDCSLLNDYEHRFVLGREMIDEDSTCHKLQLKGYIIALSANDPNRKARVHYVAFGQHASSKSWLMDSIKNSCIPVVTQHSMSTLRANTESGNFDGAICQQDEMNYASGGVGKNGKAERGEEERTFKQTLSTCEVRINETYFNEFHERKSRQGYRKCLETHMMNTNAPKRSMTPEFLDRCHAMLFMDYDRIGRNVPSLICSTRKPELARMQEESYRQKQLIHAMVYTLDMAITIQVFDEVQCSFSDAALPNVLVRAAEIGLPKTNAPRPIQRMRTIVRALTKLRAVLTVCFSSQAQKEEKFSLQLFRGMPGHLCDYDPSIFVSAFALFQEYQDAIQTKVIQVIERMLTPALQKQTIDQYKRIRDKLDGTLRTHGMPVGGIVGISPADQRKVDAISKELSSVDHLRKLAKYIDAGAAATAAAKAVNAKASAAAAAAAAAASVPTGTGKKARVEPRPIVEAENDFSDMVIDDGEDEDAAAATGAAAAAASQGEPDGEWGGEVDDAQFEADEAAAREAEELSVVGSLGRARYQPITTFRNNLGTLLADVLEDADIDAIPLDDDHHPSDDNNQHHQADGDADADADADAEQLQNDQSDQNDDEKSGDVDDVGLTTEETDLMARMATLAFERRLERDIRRPSNRDDITESGIAPPRIPLENAVRGSPALNRMVMEMKAKMRGKATLVGAHEKVVPSHRAAEAEGEEQAAAAVVEDDDDDEEAVEERDAATFTPEEMGEMNDDDDDDDDVAAEGKSKRKNPKDLTPYFYKNATTGNMNRRYVFIPTPGVPDDEELTYKKRMFLSRHICQNMHGNIRMEDVNDILRTLDMQRISRTRTHGRGGPDSDPAMAYVEGGIILHSVLIANCHANSLATIVKEVLTSMRVLPSTFLFDIKMDADSPFIFSQIKICGGSVNCPDFEFPTREQILNAVPEQYRSSLADSCSSLNVNTNAYPTEFIQHSMSMMDPTKNIKASEAFTTDQATEIDTPYELLCYLKHLDSLSMDWATAKARNILPEHVMRKKLVADARNEYNTQLQLNCDMQQPLHDVVAHETDLGGSAAGDATGGALYNEPEGGETSDNYTESHLPTDEDILVDNTHTGECEKLRYMKPDAELVQAINEVCLKPVPYSKIKAVTRAMENEFLRLTALRRHDQAMERKRRAAEMRDRRNGTYVAPPEVTAKASTSMRTNYLSREVNTLMANIGAMHNTMICV